MGLDGEGQLLEAVGVHIGSRLHGVRVKSVDGHFQQGS
jgi:hypothetical protein